MLATNNPDMEALGLYSLMGSDWPEFVGNLPIVSDKTMQILYRMLTYEDVEVEEAKLNARGAVLVHTYAHRNGIPLCHAR